MKTRFLILTIIHIAAVTACSVQPVTPSEDLRTLQSRAESAAEAGDVRTATLLYRRLATMSAGSEQAAYLIDGARLLIAAADFGTALQWLGEAQAIADAEQQKHILMLSARIELGQDRPQSALATLALIQSPIGADLIPEMGAIKGEALFSLGRRSEAVGEFVAREIWLDSAEALLDNQYAIWDGLRKVPAELQEPPTGDPIVDGWLALEPLARADDDPIAFRRALLDWRRVYVDHPAAGGLLADLLRQRRSSQAFPQQIALMLPLSGEFRSFAVAIRDGFLAGHLESSRRRESRIRIYDTGFEDLQDAYLRAQLEGADFIVGPLLPQEVESVMAQSGFVPTLALNFSDKAPPFSGSFNQFALWPEDEARAVARRAFADGARTALALVASDPYGYRLLNSFRSEFESLGGRLLSFEGYNTESQDHSNQIESLLNISRSEQRHRRLQANLRVPIEFESRRRQDVDMIFLGVNSAQEGRQLMPQLRFNKAGDVPTYATQEIYEPALASPDNDLNGVIFADAPLLLDPNRSAARLRQELEAHWPDRVAQRIRYYGMGYDAFQLMQSLFAPDGGLWPMRGVSGDLSTDEYGRIHRSQLSFAQMRDGRPETLPRAVAPAPFETGQPEVIIGRR